MTRDKRPPDSWIPDPFTGKPLTLSEDGFRIVAAGLDQEIGSEDDLDFPIPESIRNRK